MTNQIKSKVNCCIRNCYKSLNTQYQSIGSKTNCLIMMYRHWMHLMLCWFCDIWFVCYQLFCIHIWITLSAEKKTPHHKPKLSSLQNFDNTRGEHQVCLFLKKNTILTSYVFIFLLHWLLFDAMWLFVHDIIWSIYKCITGHDLNEALQVTCQ